MATRKTPRRTKKADNKKSGIGKRVIAVVGGTGSQGGGLVRAILNDKHGSFAARAITRDPNSEKAKALADAGAEVVAGDVDDVKSLRKAFDGAHGAFCVTFFWAHLKPEKELSNARNMAQAAKDAGVHHVIWSTAEDIGKTAYAIFEKGDEMIGKTVGIAGGHLTGAQLAKALSKALGQEVVYNPVSPATFRSFGFTGADDLGNMFQFYSEFEQDCCDARSISETKSLNPELQTFDRWLSQNKDRIPLG